MVHRCPPAVLAAGLAAVALAAPGCGGGSSPSATAGGGSSTAPLTASGATFPAAAYRRWGHASGLVNYSPKGSGGGIKDLIAGLVDLAGSDAPLTDAERRDLAVQRGGVTPVYFPSLLGAVSVPANVGGVTKPLRIDAKVLGDIFDGSITKWDDGAIAATNPGVMLPARAIIVCARADSSGTSFNFSRFLARHNQAFASKVGVGKTPTWGGSLEKQPGNPGVARCVAQNPGAIGYVDLGDARSAGLTSTLVQVGVGGRFTAPTTRTITQAGAAAKTDADLVVDPGAADPSAGYPITVTTWLVAYSDQATAGGGKLADLRRWLDYVYSPAAQGQLAALGFAPLPDTVVATARTRIGTLK